MIYLLQDDLTPSGYILLERTDTEEIFYNAGNWRRDIPTTFDNPSPELAQYKTGKRINWWTKAYPDYVDAKIIVRRKTHEGYLKWVSEYPEYFI